MSALSLLFSVPVNSVKGQNFGWLNGMTGRSAGHSTTTDVSGNMYVVGGFKTTTANAQFSGGSTSGAIQPSPLGLASESAGYLVKYDPITADPISSVVMLPNVSACSFYSAGDVYADAQKVVVARNGHIYVLGVFFGCSIDFYNPSGGFEFSAHQPNIQPDQKQSVFLAHYDDNMIPISCHVFASAECSDSGLAADVAIGYNDYSSVFFAANFCGDGVWAERFPIGPQPIPPYDQLPINTFSTANPAEYQIYVGQIDRASDQLIYAIEMGREGEDLASELSSGYLGSGLDLYMSGTFTDSITFIKTGSGSTSYMSNGKWDIFAVRFNGFDLNSQDEAVAGGPLNDQALALSDDGKYVGGFISEWANFPGVGVITGIGAGPYPLINSGFKQQGFIAIPDYSSHNWIWQTDVVDNGLPNVLDSQVNDISNGDCDDFYVAWNRGMMSRPLDLPQRLWTHPTLNDMNPFQLHMGAYSRIEKWEDLGTSATMLWQHDFNAPPNPTYNLSTGPIGSGAAVKARFISDIEVRSQVSIGAPGDEDVLFTGRFGDDMAVTNSILPGFDFYNANNGSPFLHNEVSMFCGALDEHPNFTIDTFEVCLLNDSFLLPWDFIPGPPFSYPFAVGNEITFSGPGVNPVTGVFNPLAAGVGTHVVWLHLDYHGCNSSHPIALIDVVADELYPKQPLSTGANWAEGLCAEGLTYDEVLELGGLNIPPDVGPYEMYFLGGRYFNQIEFEKFDGGTITLNSQGGGEAGYIVAYGPCGAFWALNIDGSGADYIEELEVYNRQISADNYVSELYAVGSIDGASAPNNLIIFHSESEPIPATTVNGGYFINGTNNIGEKGIVMKIEPLTGEVTWVYLGGDVTTEQNRFHGMRVADQLIAVAGEWAASFTNAGTGNTTANAGGYDPFIIMLDDNGNCLSTSVGTSAFGTPNDDHGDAVDVIYGTDASFYLTGTLNGNLAPITQTFNTFIGGGFVFGASDVFIAGHTYIGAGLAMNDTRLKVYNSAGADYSFDIITPTDGYGVPDVGFGTNEIFICGTFADAFNHDFGTMNTLAGATDFDIFIGSVDRFFNDQWFTHEGRSGAFTTESANALEIVGDYVYAIGKEDGVNSISNFWNSGTPVSPSLLNGTGTGGRHDIFTVKFDPSGSFSDVNFVKPLGAGLNEGGDITKVDGTLATALHTSMILSNQPVDFLDATGFNYATFTQQSNTSDAFLARMDVSSVLGYYKKDDADEISYYTRENGIALYPNPNDGLFSIDFGREFTGQFRIYNSTGKVVYQSYIQKTLLQSLDLRVGSGLYLYELNDGAKISTGRFVVN